MPRPMTTAAKDRIVCVSVRKNWENNKHSQLKLATGRRLLNLSVTKL